MASVLGSIVFLSHFRSVDLSLNLWLLLAQEAIVIIMGISAAHGNTTTFHFVSHATALVKFAGAQKLPNVCFVMLDTLLMELLVSLVLLIVVSAHLIPIYV